MTYIDLSHYKFDAVFSFNLNPGANMWLKRDVQALPNHLYMQDLITENSAHPELNFNATWFK